jgi:hypothetical protein
MVNMGLTMGVHISHRCSPASIIEPIHRQRLFTHVQQRIVNSFLHRNMSWTLCNNISMPLSSCVTFETLSHVPFALQHQCYSISGPCPYKLHKAFLGYALSKGIIRDILKSNHLRDNSIKMGFIRVLGRPLLATCFALQVHETLLTLVKFWIWYLNIH